jgi:hypothetical protein
VAVTKSQATILMDASAIDPAYVTVTRTIAKANPTAASFETQPSGTHPVGSLSRDDPQVVQRRT